MLGLLVLIYLIAATCAFLVPELNIPYLDYSDRLYYANFPHYYSAILLTFWSLAALPWLWTVYRRGRNVPVLWLVVPLGLTCIFGTLVRPPITHDVFYCLGLGRQIAIHWVSPYQVELSTYLNDPVIGSINRNYFDQKALFGPLALAIFSVPNFVGPSWNAFELSKALKLLSLIPYWILGKVLWHRWRDHPYRPAMILAILGNPVLIFLTFVEGHVDIYMVTLLVFAGVSLEKLQGFRAALYLCGACCIKLIAIVVTPVCFCWLWRNNRKESGLFISAFLLLYGSIEALIGFGDFHNTLELVKNMPHLAFAAVIPRFCFMLGINSPNVLLVISDVCFYLCIATLTFAVIRGWNSKSPFFPIALALAALVFTRTYSMAWYTLWFWPFLWLDSERGRTVLISVAIWTVSMLVYHSYYLPILPWCPAVGFALDVLWNRKRR